MRVGDTKRNLHALGLHASFFFELSEGVTQAVTIESNLTQLLPQRQRKLYIDFSHIHTP